MLVTASYMQVPWNGTAYVILETGLGIPTVVKGVSSVRVVISKLTEVPVQYVAQPSG